MTELGLSNGIGNVNDDDLLILFTVLILSSVVYVLLHNLPLSIFRQSSRIKIGHSVISVLEVRQKISAKHWTDWI